MTRCTCKLGTVCKCGALLPAPPHELDARALRAQLTDLQGKVATLYEAIAHGEPEHRAWLRDKLVEHFGPTWRVAVVPPKQEGQ